VVFQQQIGRGLRLHEGKSCCLVLDYVGLYDADYRFDVLYRSLTGLGRKQLGDAAEHGFGLLPPGCHIQLDKVARERVLSNLRQSLQINARRLRTEVVAWAAGRSTPLRLADFLRDQMIELEELYENKRSWQGLLRLAGLPHVKPSPEDDKLLPRVAMLLQVDDPRLLSAWVDWLSGREVLGRAPLMLVHQLIHENDRLISKADFLEILTGTPAVRTELLELFEYLEELTDNPGRPIKGAPAEWPLSVHARYSRREILAAIGYTTESRRPSQREGGVALEDSKLYVMFVTLDKSEGFSEQVKYHDYAISPELFAWETQNRAHPGNNLGKRFIESPANGWRFFLFVREDPTHDFAALGEVRLESWERCEKGPIPIVWRLLEPMSADMYRRFSVLRDA
jgi:hypothetical protein